MGRVVSKKRTLAEKLFGNRQLVMAGFVQGLVAGSAIVAGVPVFVVLAAYLIAEGVEIWVEIHRSGDG